MVTGWGLDPPSEIHDAQPLSGRDVNLRDVLKSSQKHTDPHHCQQLKPKTLLMFRVWQESIERNVHCERRENGRKHHPRRQ